MLDDGAGPPWASRDGPGADGPGGIARPGPRFTYGGRAVGRSTGSAGATKETGRPAASSRAVADVEKERGASLSDIESIYRERFGAFARTASAIVGDADEARDAVQEAFAMAVRRRGDFRGDGSLEGWLWRIVVNAARAHRRARRADAATAPATEEASVSPNGKVVDADHALLRELLADLPERQRLVVFLRHFADLEHARIAEALEIRPGTVAATLNAAHAALRRRLEEVTP